MLQGAQRPTSRRTAIYDFWSSAIKNIYINFVERLGRNSGSASTLRKAFAAGDARRGTAVNERDTGSPGFRSPTHRGESPPRAQSLAAAARGGCRASALPPPSFKTVGLAPALRRDGGTGGWTHRPPLFGPDSLLAWCWRGGVSILASVLPARVGGRAGWACWWACGGTSRPGTTSLCGTDGRRRGGRC